MPKYLIHYDQGTAPGPFNIYLSGSLGPLSLYASNVTRTQLMNGYIITFDDSIPSSSVLIDNIAYGCNTDKLLPFPTATPSKTPSVSVTPSVTPSITVSPSPTATPSVTPSITPSITPQPTATPSVTPSITPSQTPGISVSPTPSISISRTPSTTPAITSFLWMGTTDLYGTAYSAWISRGCNRSYYSSNPSSTPIPNSYLYNDFNRTSPVVGGNSWLAINRSCGNSWYEVQVSNTGQIINVANGF